MLPSHSCIPSNRGQLLCRISSATQPRCPPSSLLCAQSWWSRNTSALKTVISATSFYKWRWTDSRTVPETFNTAAWAKSCCMSLKLWPHISRIWSPPWSLPSLPAAPSGNTSMMKTPFWNSKIFWKLLCLEMYWIYFLGGVRNFRRRLDLTSGVSDPPQTVKPMALSFSFWNSIVVSLPVMIWQSFGSCGPSGSFGFSGSLAVGTVSGVI